MDGFGYFCLFKSIFYKVHPLASGLYLVSHVVTGIFLFRHLFWRICGHC